MSSLVSLRPMHFIMKICEMIFSLRESAALHYLIKIFFLFCLINLLTGCAIPSSGPSKEQVKKLPIQGIQVVQVTSEIAQHLLAHQRKKLFSEVFPHSHRTQDRIGAGDIIEVSVWEAPPAMLFSSSVINLHAGPSTTQVTVFPQQMVNSEGTINIPFAGNIHASGRTPSQIESGIVAKLRDKAHKPQVLVRVITNNSSDVTVVGEVASSRRVPLTPHRERLLDALAAAGGVRQEVSKMTLQITRGNKVNALPLSTIIQDPKQNIELQSGDIVTALYRPNSFTVLGAAGKNEEINFEAQGISLAQALARAGGLQDNRADAQAIFIFRLEEAGVLSDKAKRNKLHLIPVVYQMNLKDPSSFFTSQQFMVNNRDVLYVSNAPTADLQKFLNIVVSAVYPIVNVGAIAMDRL
ncbi:polysaccharide export protein Wza [Legionella massiliensis]|uniref:Polysaccharide export protein Wza n=1 Tax=Legionella massiliensis TaxID=1034943 RepID=A0A078KY12_9GAMM|nr:polysaccharide biosynthesis/export family protein [Legionella massiliensis]CDZ77846.1 polysaccharide export protein Wza [Legionella massiliensis]CEE13584.1 Polysaccharide biosynthesis/export protein [Legionella massiliensis]